MKILKEFYSSADLNLDGRIISREAVRAIILKEDQILMMHSPVKGDYKFPGGGIKERETHEEALLREIKEECGLILSEIRAEFGLVIEYARPREEDYDVYRHASYYYLCKVSPHYVGQDLDEYEGQLRLRPEWVSIDDALKQNRAILSGSFGEPPRWTERDTYVLNRVAKPLEKGGSTVNWWFESSK